MDLSHKSESERTVNRVNRLPAGKGEVMVSVVVAEGKVIWKLDTVTPKDADVT